MEPALCDEYEAHINNICKKYGISYLDSNVNSRNNAQIPMAELFKEDFKIHEGNNRHLQLLRVMDSFIQRLKSDVTLYEIKNLSYYWNQKHCIPPLDNNEYERQWKCALNFMKSKVNCKNKFQNCNYDSKDFEKNERVFPSTVCEKENGDQDTIFEGNKEDNNETKIYARTDTLIVKVSEEILSKYKLATIEETREILHYENGVYVFGGDTLIEKEVEDISGYALSNGQLKEIKGHIMRKTYHKQEEFDSDINIINLKNGLYHIKEGKLEEHDPCYLSRIQIPITYDKSAKPKLLGKFLSEVLFPKDIKTILEVMAYTFYRKNIEEEIVFLYGHGLNGKSVFTALLTKLHGERNVSNVSYDSLINDRFALADMVGKSVNIDAEVSNTSVRELSTLKKLTGTQPIRVQRKYQQPFDAELHAKLIFNTNAIPKFADNTDSIYRRLIIISFPNSFEGREDKRLLIKLTTEQELSGIFNVLMKVLARRLEDGQIVTSSNTIMQKRDSYDIIKDPVKEFLEEAIAKDSTIDDFEAKDDLYLAYHAFCKDHKIPVDNKILFGKKIKQILPTLGLAQVQEEREAIGKRRHGWRGIRLERWRPVQTPNNTQHS